MVELELETLINLLTLLTVLVVVVFVGIAYYRTRIRRLLVLLLLAGLLGVNMVVLIAEEVLKEAIPYIEHLAPEWHELTQGFHGVCNRSE